MKTLCIGYLIALTCLLVVKDPLGLFVGHSGLGALAGGLRPVAHLVGFTVLAPLALGARGRLPRWAAYGWMAAYALGTELVQAFLPWRTAELADFIQDMVGIVLGGSLFWLLGLIGRRIKRARRT